MTFKTINYKEEADKFANKIVEVVGSRKLLQDKEKEWKGTEITSAKQFEKQLAPITKLLQSEIVNPATGEKTTANVLSELKNANENLKLLNTTQLEAFDKLKKMTADIGTLPMETAIQTSNRIKPTLEKIKKEVKKLPKTDYSGILNKLITEFEISPSGTTLKDILNASKQVQDAILLENQGIVKELTPIKQDLKNLNATTTSTTANQLILNKMMKEQILHSSPELKDQITEIANQMSELPQVPIEAPGEITTPVQTTTTTTTTPTITPPPGYRTEDLINQYLSLSGRIESNTAQQPSENGVSKIGKIGWVKYDNDGNLQLGVGRDIEVINNPSNGLIALIYNPKVNELEFTKKDAEIYTNFISSANLNKGKYKGTKKYNEALGKIAGSVQIPIETPGGLENIPIIPESAKKKKSTKKSTGSGFTREAAHCEDRSKMRSSGKGLNIISEKDIPKKLEILIGEYKAGNNNKKITNQILDILQFYLDKQQITVEEMKQMIENIFS